MTGTDTGVGKTRVGVALLGALRARGAAVAVRKPAESGCERVAGELRAADAEALCRAAGSDEPIDTICPLRLAEPLAPAIAARRAGASLDIEAFVMATRARARAVDVMLVEGAGGLLVPLVDHVSCGELAARLGSELLIVVGARLGAINHALLTEAAAFAAGLPVLGFVVNHVKPGEDAARTSLTASLREFARAPVLAEIGYGADGLRELAGLAARLA